jgi:hypothetical protein
MPTIERLFVLPIKIMSECAGIYSHRGQVAHRESVHKLERNSCIQIAVLAWLVATSTRDLTINRSPTLQRQRMYLRSGSLNRITKDIRAGT